MSLGITQLKAGASRNGGSSGGVKESFPKTNLLIFFSPCWRETDQISCWTINSETLIDASVWSFWRCNWSDCL